MRVHLHLHLHLRLGHHLHRSRAPHETRRASRTRLHNAEVQTQHCARACAWVRVAARATYVHTKVHHLVVHRKSPDSHRTAPCRVAWRGVASRYRGPHGATQEMVGRGSTKGRCGKSWRRERRRGEAWYSVIGGRAASALRAWSSSTHWDRTDARFGRLLCKWYCN